ncbi:MAG: aspartate aminotransferase family protein [Candidatus Bathyarchaeia archaeon]
MSRPLKRCMEVVDRDREVISPASRIAYYPLVVSRAEGCRIWDLDGNEYLDFLSGAAVNNVGHCHPRVVEAIEAQARRLIHNTLGYSYHELPVALAERLVELTPGRFPKRVAFGLSGSDSNDGAMKLARAATGRPKIVAFLGSYHGTTFGALTLSAISLKMRRRLGPLVPEVYHVPYADCYRCYFGLEYPGCGLRCVEHIRTVLEMLIPPDEVAAFILEPIQGDAGIVIPPEEFWPEVKGLCEENGILFMDEEVQTGFGRTGRMFAVEHWGVEPDAVLSAKPLASGLPIGVIVARRELMESWPAPAHLFTTQANPVVCAAALATLEVIKRENLLERAQRRGEEAMKRFREMEERFDLIGDVRGRGLLIGVELVEDRETKEPARKEAMKVAWRAWERGLVMISFGRYGNVLRVAPPLTIEEEELEAALGIVEASIEDVVKGRVPDSVLQEMRAW